MQKGLQLWRWFTPMLLHADLLHIGVKATQYNLIMQLILGFRLEPTVGLWRTVVVYVASG
jgi:membrane associated rhomboid family serine protease